MKKLLALITSIVIVLFMGVPVWVVAGFGGFGEQERNPADGQKLIVRVSNSKTGKIMKLPLEEYLVGVIAAEMPANFEIEALKAQAIAARTYTMKRMYSFGAKPGDSHGDAEVCTNPVHCQAWEDDSELRNKWGKIKYYIYMNKIRNAVKETRGIVITYDNELIDPVYHGSCGGRGTENSEDVWTYRVPYLRSVNCDREYRQKEAVFTKEVSIDTLVSALKDELPDALSVTDNESPVIKSVTSSPRGRIQEISVLGKQITGITLRKITGLSSTLVEWVVKGDKIIFTSTGKGHAVGLCQYGANGMALGGSDYTEIISHYYTGVKLKRLE